MIPRAHITAWRSKAPWATDAQVEQDLVMSRALVDLFSDDLLARELAFRGGTALQKLHFDPPVRYSEDIDLVQVNPNPIGPVLQAMRSCLDPWLGEARWKQSQGRDLFDLSEALSRMPELDTQAIVDCFLRYMEHDGLRVTRTQFEMNLAEKMDDNVFLRDIPPLLASGTSYDPHRRLEFVQRALISKLPEGAARNRRPDAP